MIQLKIYLKRLSNPSVLISIASQIITILMLFNIKVNIDVISTVITSICSILVLLGIISNPDTQNKGYQDDLLPCSNCNKITPHVLINGNMVCQECGQIHHK